MNNPFRLPAALRRTCFCLTVLPLALAMTGCGDEAGNAADGANGAESRVADVQDPWMPDGTAAPGISAGYLAGPWCYLYFEGLGERTDERIDYVFNEDGTLLYQDNPDTPLDRPGTWKLDGDALSILPDLAMATEIKSARDDRLVLGFGAMRAVFARGSCGRENPGSAAADQAPESLFTAGFLAGHWCAGTPTSNGGWQDSALYEFRQDGSFRFAPAAYRFEFSGHVSTFEPLRDFLADPDYHLTAVDQDTFRRVYKSARDSVFTRGIGRCTNSRNG